MQMDKLVLSLVLSLVAGFLTAVVTFVKLVNDKESKVTEFRQQWTDTAREALASVLSQLRSYCSLTIELVKTDDDVSRLAKQLGRLDDSNKSETTRLQVLLDSQVSQREALMQALRDSRESIHGAYALARLHFKPGDPGFLHVETKVDQALSLMDEWIRTDNQNGDALRAKAIPLIDEMTNLCRKLLKREWEKIKVGEPAYTQTKIWAKRGGLLGAGALSVLIAWFGIESLLSWKETSDKTAFANASAALPHNPLPATSKAPTPQEANPVWPTFSCSDATPPYVTIVQQTMGGIDRVEKPVASNPRKAPKKDVECSMAGTK